MAKNVFQLVIFSRSGKLYDGQVVALTSYNEKGKFDVLAQHANFISLITSSLTLQEVSGREQKISFDTALMRVRENFAEVYVGIEGQVSSGNQI